MIYKYDNTNGTWESASYSAALGTWVPDNFKIYPGDGAFLYSPTNFTLTITGTPVVPVLPVNISNGACYLLANQTNSVGTYENIVGLSPTNGATIYEWNGSNYNSFTYESGLGSWVDASSNSVPEPTVPVGEAVWISPSGTPPPVGSQTYSITIQSGVNIIANQLDHGSNTLDEVIPEAPDGTTILKWDCASQSYTAGDTYYTGLGWYDSIGNPSTTALAPGEGAVLQNPGAAFTLTFSGIPHVPSLPPNLPCGYETYYLLARQTNGIGTYENITGYAPQEGAKVVVWNGASYTTYTFTGGSWDLGAPSLAIGQAARFYIPSPELSYEGLLNQALGAATLSLNTQSNQLTIGNIGTNGQDGVSIAVPNDMTALDVHYASPDVSNTLPVGAYIQEQAVGMADGISNGVLGTVTVTKAGTSNFVMTADFSALGTTNCIVQAYRNGILVGQTTNHAGAGDVIVSWVLFKDITGWSADLEWETTNGDISLSTDYGPDDEPVDAVLGGGPTVVCDHLFITPLGNPVYRPTAFRLTASQIPTITITSENESLVYQGLVNTSLGNASLGVIANQLDHGSNPPPDDVYVGNLGSNGEDGVSIALPDDLTGLVVAWDDLDPSNTLPAGAYVQSQIVGTANGITNGVLGTATMTKAGTSNYVISADYSAMNANSYTVQAYLNGTLVRQATNSSGVPLTSTKRPTVGADIHITFRPFKIKLHSIEIEPESSVIAGSNVTWDTLELTPIEASLPSALTAFQIVASRIPAITITNEIVSVDYAGLTHTALGDATLSVIANQLDHGSNPPLDDVYIGNIGSSGEDGVSIALNPGNNFAGTWLPLDPSNTLPVGAYVQSQMVGTAGNVTNGVLGWTRCTKMGTSNYVISVDYSSLGSSAHTVQVYNGSELVAQVTGQTNSICATVKLPPGTCTINPWLNMDWPDPVLITIPDGPVVMGTEILMIPEGGATVSSITADQILAANIPSITITNEIVSVSYAGLNMTPVGNASLSVIANQLDHGSNPPPDDVYIGNLGSNGEDGVSITLPSDLGALDMNWQPLDPSNSLPVGAYVQEQCVGTAGAVSNGSLGTVTMTKAGTSNFVVSADFSPIGASNYTVQAYLNGALVTQATNQPGAALAACNYWGDSGCIPPPISLPPILGGGWDRTNWLVSIAGGSAVLCDHLYVLPENVSGTETAFRIVASQVPSLTVMSATVSPLLVHANETGPDVTLHWYGTSTLQESADLATWTDVTNAASPYQVFPPTSGPAKFYRLIFRP